MDDRGDKIIPAQKLELTPDEAQATDAVNTAANDPVPPAPSFMDEITNLVAASAAAFGLASGPTAKWPSDDGNAPDYRHLSRSQVTIDQTFSLVPDDLELVIKSNRFDPHGKLRGNDASPDEVIAIAARGLMLGTGALADTKFEVEDARSVQVTDARPDHQNYRCLIGFYVRTAAPGTRTITLYAGSTVPNPFLMNAYRAKVQAHTHEPFEKCNMLPTGCYVCRVDHHKTIKPALRMADPADLKKDATCTVVRTFNDLTYSVDDFWDLCQPTDNVHCAFATSRNAKWRAAFSSEGCLTVRAPRPPAINGRNTKRCWPRSEPAAAAICCSSPAGISRLPQSCEPPAGSEMPPSCSGSLSAFARARAATR
jgi:hypothetical protein